MVKELLLMGITTFIASGSAAWFVYYISQKEIRYKRKRAKETLRKLFLNNLYFKRTKTFFDEEKKMKLFAF